MFDLVFDNKSKHIMKIYWVDANKFFITIRGVDNGGEGDASPPPPTSQGGGMACTITPRFWGMIFAYLISHNDDNNSNNNNDNNYNINNNNNYDDDNNNPHHNCNCVYCY